MTCGGGIHNVISFVFIFTSFNIPVGKLGVGSFFFIPSVDTRVAPAFSVHDGCLYTCSEA